MFLCEYGCGNHASFVVTKQSKWCCSPNYQSCPKIKSQNSNGAKKAYTDSIRQSAKNQYQNLEQKTKDYMAWSRNKILTENGLVKESTLSNHAVKSYLLNNNILKYECKVCKITDWQGTTIVLELDHINGQNTDNRVENLRLLCPNCHSQTSNFRGKNINTGKQKVSDEDLIVALKNSKNIRLALISVGLAAKGANYYRAAQLKKQL